MAETGRNGVWLTDDAKQRLDALHARRCGQLGKIVKMEDTIVALMDTYEKVQASIS